MSIDCSLKSLTSSGSNELLQSHNSLTFKLLKTVADFSQALANLHDKFGHELQMLVETFRKRNGELRKERFHCPNSLFQIWELFLQQVEVNSQQHGDISRNFSQSIGNGLIERVFHRKIQSKKIFAHRDRVETILLKSNELLIKCYNDYCQAYALALTNPAQYMSEYIASHNVYLHQLQATNGMIHAYQTKTLPRLLEELEECHLETSLSISSSLLDSSELVSEKSNEQVAGYQVIASACRQANHKHDLAQFVKVASSAQLNSGTGNELTSGSQLAASGGSNGHQQDEDGPLAGSDNHNKSAQIRYHHFQAPSLQNAATELGQFDPTNLQIVPKLKNEIATDLSQPKSQQQPQLEKDREGLEEKIEKLEERIESLCKVLARSSESRLYNKVNELQEEICLKRFDLLVAQIHLSAVRAQLQLFEYNYRPNNLVQLQHPNQQQSQQQQQQQSPQQYLQHLSGKGGQELAFGGAGVGPDPSGVGSGVAVHQAPLGYRNKWIKALKSLKETPAPSNSGSNISGAGVQGAGLGAQQKFLEDVKKHGSEVPLGQQQQLLQQQQGQAGQQPENQHFFQEYTFKKIASCDVCKEFLRGHMRQGVKCKLCKISCHNDCQSKAHATLKCQQPKIKLLRRQKSAGELEINNSDVDNGGDTGERLSSKPDGSMYQIIRQLLDAKKKGTSSQQQQQQQQQQLNDASDAYLRVGGLGNSAMMNLSTGNLALANQNGKSVSTSALGNSSASAAAAAAASVDRWAVVMDLLAQSRRKGKDSESMEGGGGGGNNIGPSSGPRHSKQLDKFKLAAKSAAAASKSQRHRNQEQHQQQLSPANQSQATPMRQSSPTGLHQTQADQGKQLAATSSSPLGHQYGQQQPGGLDPSSSMGHQSHLVPMNADVGGGGYLGQLSHQPTSSGVLEQQAQQPPPLQHQSMLSLHHTKSLPVGKLPVQQQQQLQPANLTGGPQISMAMGSNGEPLMQAGPSSSTLRQHQQQQQPQHQHQQLHMQPSYHQLLNIGVQQLQSTSAPHSPQRKRFNLRMKSFSLDSPESPSVLGTTPSAGDSGYQQQQQSQSQQPLQGSQTNLQGMEAVRQSYEELQHVHHHQQQQHQLQRHQHHQQLQQHHGDPLQRSGQMFGQHQLYVSHHVGQQQAEVEAAAAGGGGVGYQQQQYYQQQHYMDHLDDKQLTAYLSAKGLSSGRHSSGDTNQQYNQHRHSYHNPGSSSFHYHHQQQQQQLNNRLSTAGEQLSSSHSALNLIQQQQQQATDKRAPKSSGSGQDPKKAPSDVADVPDPRNDYYDLNLDVGLRSGGAQQQQSVTPQQPPLPPTQATATSSSSASSSPQSGTYVVLYDYVAQRGDELQLGAGQVVCVLETSERDWWQVRTLDGSNRIGYFPSSYLAKLYQNERPLQVAQTIQVSNGETCDKLLRGQMDNFVTIRLVSGGDLTSHHYIQCPDKYLMEVGCEPD